MSCGCFINTLGWALGTTLREVALYSGPSRGRPGPWACHPRRGSVTGQPEPLAWPVVRTSTFSQLQPVMRGARLPAHCEARLVRACAGPRGSWGFHGDKLSRLQARSQDTLAPASQGPQLQGQGRETPGGGPCTWQSLPWLWVFRGQLGPCSEGWHVLQLWEAGEVWGRGGNGADVFVPARPLPRSPRPRRAHLLCSSLMRTMRLRWPWEYCSMTSRTS